MITTVIGAYPKPKYIEITDWFNNIGGTDNPNPAPKNPSPDPAELLISVGGLAASVASTFVAALQ